MSLPIHHRDQSRRLALRTTQKELQMFTFLLVLPVVILVVAVLVMPWWWPIVKVGLAGNKLFFATVRENSALGRRRGRNTWMMYIRLTKETYEDIVREGGNPFTLDPEQVCSFEELESKLKPHYKLVSSKDATVRIGWPWKGYETVTPWYFTANLKDAAPKKKLGDEGGDENHTIPLKIQTTNFPIPLGDVEQAALQNRIALARADKGERLTVDEIRRTLSLNVPETADGFKIPCVAEVDWTISGPWSFITTVEFLGDQMYGLLNTALLNATANLRALVGVDQDYEADIKSAFMHRLGSRLSFYAGMPTNGVPADAATVEDTSFDRENSMVRVLGRMGVTIHRIRLMDINLPKELHELLNRPATERAQMRADVIAADKRVQVAARDADARAKAGEGERRFQEELAKGDTARIAVWTVDEATASRRLEQQRIEAWREGVTKPGTGKVIITGAPGAPVGSSGLEGLVAKVATVVQEVTHSTSDGETQATPPSGESKD